MAYHFLPIRETDYKAVFRAVGKIIHIRAGADFDKRHMEVIQKLKELEKLKSSSDVKSRTKLLIDIITTTYILYLKLFSGLWLHMLFNIIYIMRSKCRVGIEAAMHKDVGKLHPVVPGS